MDPVTVVNMALAEIGAQSQVSSINPSDGSPEANIASLLYQPKIDSLMRAAHWNCLRKQVYLSQLKSAMVNGQASSNPPPSPWAYTYAYPSDCLKMRFLLPDYRATSTDQLSTPLTTADTYASPITCQEDIRFLVGLDTDANNNPIKVIMTNCPNAQGVYTARIADPNLWDVSLLNAATAMLGAWFVNALSRNRALLQDQVKIATQIILEARVSDGNEGPMSMDHQPDWMRARAASAYSQGMRFQPYDSISIPGGMAF